jgi:CBS domain-containing protein
LSDDAEEAALSIRVKDVMAKEPIMVESERTVKETAIEMDRSGHGCLLVTSDGKIVGIITERDLVRKAMTRGGSLTRTKIKNIMSCPLIVVAPDTSVEEAAKIMAKHKVRRLPVVGTGRLAGLITVTDIARYLAERSADPQSLLKAMARSGRTPKIYT